MAQRETLQEKVKECAHCTRVQGSQEVYMKIYGNLYCLRCYRKIDFIMTWDIINTLKSQLWELAEKWLWEKEAESKDDEDDEDDEDEEGEEKI